MRALHKSAGTAVQLSIAVLHHAMSSLHVEAAMSFVGH